MYDSAFYQTERGLGNARDRTALPEGLLGPARGPPTPDLPTADSGECSADSGPGVYAANRRHRFRGHRFQICHPTWGGGAELTSVFPPGRARSSPTTATPARSMRSPRRTGTSSASTGSRTAGRRPGAQVGLSSARRTWGGSRGSTRRPGDASRSGLRAGPTRQRAYTPVFAVYQKFR